MTAIAAMPICNEESFMGGDERPVAVLFSDIRGFTALSERTNPFAMAKLLSEYFTEMAECVSKFGGSLDKFMGDSLMARWGAPMSADDDPDQALNAALAMMKALAKLNARWEGEGRPPLEIGIGLNFGEAFAGNIGSEQRLEYTIIGDTVNVASRLCDIAAGGQILMTDSFREQLHSGPAAAPMNGLELKGKSEAVRVYRLLR